MKNLSHPSKWIFLGIPFLFVIGGILHSLYSFSHKLLIVGLISPVNESVWEHCKMILFPVITWWYLYYFINGKKYGIDKNSWFSGAMVAFVISFLSLPFYYYFYTGAFGIESIFVDIFILLLGIAFGQCIGHHIYTYSKGINYRISILIFIIIVIIFTIFTFYPPHLPLFMDSETGIYGIYGN